MPAVTTADARPRWPLAQRVGLRFAFLYALVYVGPGALVFGLFDYPGFVSRGFDALNAWSAVHLLHLASAPLQHPTGSGDTLFDWVSVLDDVALAVMGAAVWSIVDRKRPSYPTLWKLLRVFVRYTLISLLLAYGCGKIFPAQFPAPDPRTLMEPYGRSSPMHLMWTFMGLSTGYQRFAGISEATAALLLVFRRTTTLGALLAIAVMTQVVILNFCFDVPVKLTSMHMDAMAVFVLLPDIRRLADMFVLGRAVPAPSARVPFTRRWLERGLLAFKVLYVGAMIVVYSFAGYSQWKTQNAPPSVLAGLYTVESFQADGAEHPPLETDGERWRRVAIFGLRGIVVQRMDESMSRFLLAIDEPARTASLTPVPTHPEPPAPDAHPFPVHYEILDANHVTLAGRFDGRDLKVTLRREDPASYLLTTRGFHWVTEYPYNR